MRLSVEDRVYLLEIVPTKSDYLTLRNTKKLKEDLAFSEAELILLSFVKDADGVLTWDPNHGIPKKTITMRKEVSNILYKILKQMSSEKELSERFMGLYRKFVLRPEDLIND